MEGLPKGQKIDMGKVQRFLALRSPAFGSYSSGRNEADVPVARSGLHSGVTFGPPVTIVIENTDASHGDYREFFDVPRPSHADYTARLKYGESVNMSGGGPFSGRMTAPLCIAGSIALQILENYGAAVCAHILSIGDVKDQPMSPVGISEEAIKLLEWEPFPVLSEHAGHAMRELMASVKAAGDSIGGVAECCVAGFPAGKGGPMYDGVESCLSQVFFGIPAVKGVEFGAGFSSSRLKGSENNDEFYYDEGGSVKTRTNNHGGILGGITSGMPIVARVAFKPVPSISIKQNSVNLKTGENESMSIGGRHDTCVVPRAVHAVKAAMAIGLLDLILADG